MEELVQFIEGPKDNNIKSRTPQSKSKQLHKQHNSEDGGAKPKKRHTKSGSKELSAGGPEDARHELKVNVTKVLLWCSCSIIRLVCRKAILLAKFPV